MQHHRKNSPLQTPSSLHHPSSIHSLPFILMICAALSLCLPIADASDVLQSEGMGGVVTALRSIDAGTELNPAALVYARDNHLAFHLGTSGWRHANLGESDEARFSGDLAGRIQPAFYYTRGMGRYGISIGYRADLDNSVRLSLLKTQSTYFVNEQRFEAQTDLALLYDSLWEHAWFLAVGYHLESADIGVRLKRVVQTAKQGELMPSLYLYAQLEDVNPNKADEVIPAIMDGLDYDKDKLEHPLDQVDRDVTVGAWDFDIGMQTDWFAQRFNIPGLTAGVLLKDVFQRRRVTASPTHLTFGANWQAYPWLKAVAEFGKRFGDAGPDIRLGWEATTDWKRYAVGGIAVRNGWSRRNGVIRISLGLALRLGSATWEYALSKRTHGESLGEAHHSLASTVRF